MQQIELSHIYKILQARNISAGVIEVFREQDRFTEYLLDKKYILRISEAELPEQAKHYRINSLSFISKIHSSGICTVSGQDYYCLIFDYIQGGELFHSIQTLTDEQKYNVGKEIAQFLIELRSITGDSYDMGHYIPTIPKYKGLWKDGHIEYVKLLKSNLAEMNLESDSKKAIKAAFEYIDANIDVLDYQTGAKLLHNDFHPKNIIIHEGRLAGITDWECSQFGEPDFELTHLFHWCIYQVPGNKLELLLKSVVENLQAVLYVPDLAQRLTIYQLEHDMNQIIWRGKIQEKDRIQKINDWLGLGSKLNRKMLEFCAHS
jgi:aminoglycoside phosphotransferase (APT) family kinase protein